MQRGENDLLTWDVTDTKLVSRLLPWKVKVNSGLVNVSHKTDDIFSANAYKYYIHLFRTTILVHK